MTNEENEVQRSLGRIEGQLLEMKLQLTSLNTAFISLEAGRLSAVEKQVANISGKLTVWAIVVSTLISSLLFVIEKYFLR